MDMIPSRRRQAMSDRALLRYSRWATWFWGLFATVTAFFVGSMGPVIEVVNLLGSYFYGSLSGVFALAFVLRRSRGSTGWLSLGFGFLLVLFTDRVINSQTVLIERASAATRGLPLVQRHRLWWCSCLRFALPPRHSPR